MTVASRQKGRAPRRPCSGKLRVRPQSNFDNPDYSFFIIPSFFWCSFGASIMIRRICASRSSPAVSKSRAPFSAAPSTSQPPPTKDNTLLGNKGSAHQRRLSMLIADSTMSSRYLSSQDFSSKCVEEGSTFLVLQYAIPSSEQPANYCDHIASRNSTSSAPINPINGEAPRQLERELATRPSSHAGTGTGRGTGGDEVDGALESQNAISCTDFSSANSILIPFACTQD